ncbi:MAG: acetyl-CoA carboxylase biotin carboxyl carrier protein [candidate division Zixibacteria bacterium]|nr:acetyl-CoA carboxylase biotin carboxyl carrier protein [candidate division Zixibacteria bacterium]
MNEKYIKKLIRMVEDSDIASLEVSSWGRKVKITHRDCSASDISSGGPVVVHQSAATPIAPPPPPVAATPEASPVADDIGNLVPIKSPIVGTFYSAPAPDADPYAALNQKVNIGQVVCIVEAMKLMNEIESEVSGRVVKILVQNAEPVEFGQTIFLIEPE